jgi:hypothetical protein
MMADIKTQVVAGSIAKMSNIGARPWPVLAIEAALALSEAVTNSFTAKKSTIRKFGNDF